MKTYRDYLPLGSALREHEGLDSKNSNVRMNRGFPRHSLILNLTPLHSSRGGVVIQQCQADGMTIGRNLFSLCIAYWII